MKAPEEYNEGMLWMLEAGEGYLIGITQEACENAGVVSEIDAGDAGDEYEAGDWIGEIRGKNSVLDIVAPFDLKILERNEQVIGQPSLVEDDPTGDAWILRVERNG